MKPKDRLLEGLHARGALPHLKREGATYFVTFRLADTLPREFLMKCKQERAAILSRAACEGRPLTWREQKELFHWYSERVDAYLDAGRGACWLSRPEIADLVAGALQHFEGSRYELFAWAIMPNHVHVVVRPGEAETLSAILKSWKGYTAVQANRILGQEGSTFWQRESYDHLCRDEEDIALCSQYTEMNPVAAKLCAQPQDWKWSSAHVRHVGHVGQVSDLPVSGVSDSESEKGPPSEKAGTVRPEA